MYEGQNMSASTKDFKLTDSLSEFMLLFPSFRNAMNISIFKKKLTHFVGSIILYRYEEPLAKQKVHNF